MWDLLGWILFCIIAVFVICGLAFTGLLGLAL